jgi:hypothetical protein
VHGSIGYSTNLFPAMTLGCGAPGGNITSDNIGPQHLMNVKRIAWEARGVEHRTVPADQRMSGAATVSEPKAVQEKEELPGTPASVQAALTVAPLPAGRAPVPPESKAEEKVAAGPGSSAAASVGMDRAAIARIVESVLSAQGIARGSGSPKAGAVAPPPPPPSTAQPSLDSPAVAAPKEKASPASIAAEIADRLFGRSAANSKTVDVSALSAPTSGPAKASTASGSPPPSPAAATGKPVAPVKPAIEIQVFVSENDVRRAMTRCEKIFIGRKTILTPSARDLGLEHEIFVETESGSIR